MKFNRKFSGLVALNTDSIKDVLRRIDQNRSGIIFITDEKGILLGGLTDGDFRRWAMNVRNIDLMSNAVSIMNQNIVKFNINEDPKNIEHGLNSKVKIIPLIDKTGRLVAVASKESDGVWIDDKLVSMDSSTFVIAEVGINHNGNFNEAKWLVDAATDAGADCVKFQMRDLNSLYSNSGDANDHSEDLGSQYVLDILTRFQLTDNEMFEVFDYCKRKGVIPLCTPWDIKSLEKLEKYGMLAYKVASADLTNHELLNALIATGKSLIISTGMSVESEILEAVNILRARGANFILLHCNSTYPAPFKDINLAYLDRLRELGGGPIGYSGHERGFNIAVAAVARGARVIEKHFTRDRNQEGNDHKVSLVPEEFKQMVAAIKQVEASLGSSNPRQITQGEKMNRENLAKSLFIKCDIKKGQTIEASMLDIKSPGKGIQPNRRFELIGIKAKRDMKAGSYFFNSDLARDQVSARNYKCKRRWGVPVRFHDYLTLKRKSNPDFLEFHLSYKDLELKIGDHIKERQNIDLVVHSPDLFPGDHLLDLAAQDPEYRKHSIAELQRVIDFTGELASNFNVSGRVKLIASLGGFTRDAFVSDKQCDDMFSIVAESLSKLNTNGVSILPQTLPPFPWYFGGQLYLNIFTDHDKTARFCKDTGMYLCFDVSHSKLSCNYWKIPFEEFIAKVGPFTDHLHLVDAAGTDGEGLQIGDGEIDFANLGKLLDQFCPKATFIPEIWQGHKDEGEAFWIAMEKLERWF